MDKQKLNLSKPVKLKNPEPGEEHIIYRIANHNEHTQRVYIEPTNMSSTFAILPQELVSVSDIVNV